MSITGLSGVPKATLAFESSEPSETTAYYDHLLRRGLIGQVAFGLFRASKRSDRAKGYRRRAHRGNAYDAKNEALKYLNAALGAWTEFSWGWAVDSHQEFHRHVLYVDLPTGQASFHSATNFGGRLYDGVWDGQGKSVENVLSFCDQVAGLPVCDLGGALLMPFGSYVGAPLAGLQGHYREWLLGWDGMKSWPLVAETFASLAPQISS